MLGQAQKPGFLLTNKQKNQRHWGKKCLKIKYVQKTEIGWCKMEGRGSNFCLVLLSIDNNILQNIITMRACLFNYLLCVLKTLNSFNLSAQPPAYFSTSTSFTEQSWRLVNTNINIVHQTVHQTQMFMWCLKEMQQRLKISLCLLFDRLKCAHTRSKEQVVLEKVSK